MASSSFYGFLTGALLACAVCTTTPTQTSPTNDSKGNLVVTGTVPASVSPAPIKEVKSFKAADYLLVPEAPVMAYDVLNDRYERVMHFVEPRCNSPGRLSLKT